MSYTEAFTTLRAMISNPTMRAIRPWASQTPPAGYTYDATYGRHLSGSTVWEPVTASLAYDSIAILPGSGSEIAQLTAGGVIPTGDRFVRVLAAVISTVEAAEFFVLDSVEYVLVESTPMPAGAALWHMVHLRKR